jgi:hypothetical protein
MTQATSNDVKYRFVIDYEITQMLREIEKKQLISKFQAAEAYNDQLATP